MPQEKIARNIEKGERREGKYEDLSYELYGHAGVGLIVEGTTDNRNRMASEIRTILSKAGGTLSSPGAVAFNFSCKGRFYIERGECILQEEEFLAFGLENGVEDIEEREDLLICTVPFEAFSSIREKLENGGLTIRESVVERVPHTWISCLPEATEKNKILIELLESIEDVHALFHNMLLREK